MIVTPGANTPPQKRRVLSARRFVLLTTTVAVLGATALVAAPELNWSYPSALAQNLTEQAHKLNAPVGFADIVAKVKPAVISVRVKMDGGEAQTTGLGDNEIPPGLREFFRRFGMPGAPGMPGNTPQGRGGHNVILGQGSGFFISADGYVVTNNHVVEKAETVKVTTDDGKTYTAKVIGTDPRTDLALIKVDGGPIPLRQTVRQRSAHRRLGAGGRQSVRPRRHRHRRHRLGARPRHRRIGPTTISSRSTRR